jgi:uncharacterized protein (TIGR03790 family)
MKHRLLPVAMILLAAAARAQHPLAGRVLVLVNDKMPKEAGTGSTGASVFVGQYYAAKRGIPAENIVHLKTSTEENIGKEDFEAQIATPLRKFLDAGVGAMRQKILYIVPVYGVPVQVGGALAVDSVLSVMYAGHEELKPPLRNPYYGPTGSRPPHFDDWVRQFEAAGGFKLFLVTRLDGPSAMIAKGLVDKALEGEKSPVVESGTAYFDYQGTRQPSEWQYAVDEEIKAAAEASRARGFKTVLHTQRDASCGSSIPSAGEYRYDESKRDVAIDAMGATSEAIVSLAPVAEGEFAVRFREVGVQNHGTLLFLTLSDASGQSYIKLRYPLTPFQSYNPTDSAVIEKVLNGAHAAKGALSLNNGAGAEINRVSELRIAVHGNSIAAFRDRRPLVAADDKSAPFQIARMAFGLQCGSAGLMGFTATGAGDAPLWNDNFATDSTAQYTWKMAPMGGPNASWVWGWYVPAFDSYRFVPGAVGAQLTSFTAVRIRAPQNADPHLQSWSNARWGGNWVPRMLEEGVTATWGAVTEPYATFYARGGDVFDHLWAGYNFGESFYIAENAARWVMVAVGDPLYTPALSKR